MDTLQQIKHATKYLSDLGTWLWRTRPLIWALVAIVVVAVLGLLISSCLERYVRFSGMGLQLIGVILVGIGLRDTRRAFNDQPTTWEGIKQWWTGRPRFGPRHHSLEASSGIILSAGMSARASVTAGPDASLEQRLEILEREHAALRDEVGKLSGETTQKIGELSNAIAVGTQRTTRSRSSCYKAIRESRSRRASPGAGRSGLLFCRNNRRKRISGNRFMVWRAHVPIGAANSNDPNKMVRGRSVRPS